MVKDRISDTTTTLPRFETKCVVSTGTNIIEQMKY